ncbi:MAG TPA: YigZ family protein [Bacilli bacterium]|jgi:uncharacterized YigZ family protein|nr:YigZ family protein [Bacilli bacterium]
MKTILENYVTEIEVERSRFIALLYPLKSEVEVNSILDEVKKEYRNARHYCYAYRFNDSERASDDGEPKGTAGRPMLDLLQKNDLQHVLLVVVRYFGGTLLGAGRLLRTYVASGKAVLGLATIVPIQTVYKYQFKIQVDELDAVYSFANLHNIPFDSIFGEKSVVITFKSNKDITSLLEANFYDKQIIKTEE